MAISFADLRFHQTIKIKVFTDKTPMNLRFANMNEDNTGVLPINRDRLSGN
jgi:hypothetical protein